MFVTAGLLWLLAEILVPIILAFLRWDRIKSWFTDREGAVTREQDNIRITLHEKMKTGRHRVVYGIFNKTTSKFVDGESVEAEEIDDELKEFHKNDALVLYT